MDYLIYAIIPLVVSILLPITFSQIQKNIKMKEKKLDKNSFVMKASKNYCILFIIMTIFLSIVVIILNVFEEIDLATNIVLDLILILMAIGCIQALRQKIIVIKDAIEYTPIIGKT